MARDKRMNLRQYLIFKGFGQARPVKTLVGSPGPEEDPDEEVYCITSLGNEPVRPVARQYVYSGNTTASTTAYSTVTWTVRGQIR